MREAPELLAFLLQTQSLLHAEAMLLVDDHEREVGKIDAFLKERMRAHDEPHFSCGNGCERALRIRALCDPDTSATGSPSG